MSEFGVQACYALQYSGAQWVQRLGPKVQGYTYCASAFVTERVKSSFSAIEGPRQHEHYTPCNGIRSGQRSHNMSNSSWDWKQADLGGPGVVK